MAYKGVAIDFISREIDDAIRAQKDDVVMMPYEITYGGDVKGDSLEFNVKMLTKPVTITTGASGVLHGSKWIADGFMGALSTASAYTGVHSVHWDTNSADATAGSVTFDNDVRYIDPTGVPWRTEATPGAWYQEVYVGAVQPFFTEKPVTKETQLKRKIQRQLFIEAPRNGRGDLVRAARVDFSTAAPNEIKALHLLRKMVSTDMFRKYLKTGYISYISTSGITYVIRRNFGHILVYKMGKLIAELCLALDSYETPPTDTVITKLVYAKYSEESLWKKSNIYWKEADDSFKNISRSSFREEHLIQLATA